MVRGVKLREYSRFKFILYNRHLGMGYGRFSFKMSNIYSLVYEKLVFAYIKLEENNYQKALGLYSDLIVQYSCILLGLRATDIGFLIPYHY